MAIVTISLLQRAFGADRRVCHSIISAKDAPGGRQDIEWIRTGGTARRPLRSPGKSDATLWQRANNAGTGQAKLFLNP